MSKQFPVLRSDQEAEAFLDQDLSPYLTAENLHPVRFELAPKTERVNMRLPRPLLEAVKRQAAVRQIPYQRYIRSLLEAGVQRAEKAVAPRARRSGAD